MNRFIKTTLIVFIAISPVICFNSCKEDLTAPMVTTEAVSEVSQYSAVSGGNVTSNGGSEVTDRGVCWATSANPTIENSKTSNGAGDGQFVSYMTELTPGTLYYVRAYATNDIGTGYGNEVNFTTPVVLSATLTTSEVSAITASTAVSGGDVTNDGGGTILAKGVCWNTSTNPVITDYLTIDGEGTGPFTSNLTNLSPGTTYYVRAYATNSSGTSYGNEVTFITGVVALASLTTTEVTDITTTSAVSGGVITNDGGAAIIEKGICWNTEGSPVITDNKLADDESSNSFVTTLTGLSISTTYYVRAYATNSAGTGYGNEVSFTTVSVDCKDYDNNNYATVSIGEQIWMAENLKTTHYSDGTAISYPGSDNAVWSANTTGAYAWYSNDATYKDTYGALYNWHAVNTGLLCPAGWHVPTNSDWLTLTDYLGGLTAGGKLKEAGTEHWTGANTGATNESGFTALPGGIRSDTGGYALIGTNGFWWSATDNDATTAWDRHLATTNTTIYVQTYPKGRGFSVRCVKNAE